MKRTEGSLTEILEHVARTIQDSPPEDQAPRWESLDLNQRRAMKQALLPIVMAALDKVDSEPIYLVTDIEGERVEVYHHALTALERTNELNERMGEGFAFFEEYPVLGDGERPKEPHHGF